MLPKSRLLTLLLVAALAATATLAPAAVLCRAAEEAPAEKPDGKTTTLANGCTIEKFTVPSRAMGRKIDVWVVLPPAYGEKTDARFGVLYALHGRGAPWTTWSDMNTLRSALKDKPMLVVGFNGDKAGWYIDATQKADSKFTTFMLRELIPHVDKTYRTKADRRHRGVTGFSMGGFGALHYYLVAHGTFGSVSSLSGAFYAADIKRLTKDYEALLGPREGNERAWAVLDLPGRLKAFKMRKVRKGLKDAPLYIACGTEDHLLEQSQKMRDLATKLGLSVEYVESPGAHNWAYWKGAAAGVVDFHWRSFEGIEKKPAEGDTKDE